MVTLNDVDTHHRAVGPAGLLGRPVQPPKPMVYDISIIVPTRNESRHVPELLRRLDAALGDICAEVLFVDDSDDNTPTVVRAEADQIPRTIRVMHRPPEDRQGELGGAIVMGLRIAQAPWALVMDGRLQHPPELIPELFAATKAGDVDLVYGSAYVGSGDAVGVSSRTRALVSASSRGLARVMFPQRLSRITDPTTGLFAVRLASLDCASLRPPGYQLLREILTVSPLRRSVEIPFTSRPGFSVACKASVADSSRYLQYLLALRTGLLMAQITQLTAFLAVGLSGVAVNTDILWLLSLRSGNKSYVVASLVATSVAICWNFLLLEFYISPSRREYSPWTTFWRFFGLNLTLLPLQLGLLALFVDKLRVNAVLANVLSLTIILILRFVAVREAPLQHTSAHRRRGTPSESLLNLADATMKRCLSQAPPLSLRLAAVVAAALLAFPTIAIHEWQTLTRGDLPALEMLAAVGAAVLLVIIRAVPAKGEPDIHDRQVDYILAFPAFVVTFYTAFGWQTHLGSSGTLGPREVAAFTSFLLGASLLVAGTRCTARIRWLFYLQFLVLADFGAIPLLIGVGCAFFVAVTAAITARSNRTAESPSAAQVMTAEHDQVAGKPTGDAVTGPHAEAADWPPAQIGTTP